ncbi:S4 domain-containing protein YaaA [Paenibacillus turpanensis]|uniref:S4 domain-containing protein YaaA n=1 Tax=Paenibacillus turpanensis TaxID=2689078 RepID=UPI00140D207B|nr:S4 domain-containing protein YaaA [Paenibacillus turpanensis]
MVDQPVPVSIDTDHITLGQMLKISDCISTGGQAKFFLAEVAVQVNGEPEQRRGRKLYPGDTIEVEGFGPFIIVSS